MQNRANTMKWAPFGGRCLIAYLENGRTGVLEFVDVGNYKQHSETTVVEHQNCREVYWDPSGRYLVSAATQPLDSKSSGDDTGYRIWTYQGEELYHENLRYFYQIMWRPRPRTLLTTQEMKKLGFKNSKERKEYAMAFDECDTEILREHTSKRIKANLQKLEEWNRFFVENDELNELKDEIDEKQRQLRAHYRIDYKNEYDLHIIEEEINVEFMDNVISKEVLNKINNDEYVDFNLLDAKGNLTKNMNQIGMNMNVNGAVTTQRRW